MDERFDRIDERFVEVDRRFDRVDERFNEVDRRVDRRFDKVDHELGRINDRLDDLSKIMIGGIITFTAAVLSGFIAIVALVATQI